VANCAAAGIPAGFQNIPARTSGLAYLDGGNPDLKEEEGTSYTIGAVFIPSFLPGFALAVDYWNIEVENLIASLSAQTILNECYGSTTGINNPYCTTIRRDADGFFIEPFLVASGFNFARQETSGLDFDASYQHTLGNGHLLGSRFIATYLIELNDYTNPADPNFANRRKSELGDPQLGFNFSLNYDTGPVDLGYQYRYIGSQTIDSYEAQHSFKGRAPTNRDSFPRKWYPAVGYHSIRAEWQMNDMVAIFGGVDNLLDELPPLGLTGTGGGDPFDSIGRYYYAGVKVEI
jgi:outer membrane receptor protein involved in Fe transport